MGKEKQLLPLAVRCSECGATLFEENIEDEESLGVWCAGIIVYVAPHKCDAKVKTRYEKKMDKLLKRISKPKKLTKKIEKARKQK